MSNLPRDLLLDLPNKTPDAVRAVFTQLGYTPQRSVNYSATTLGWAGTAAAELRGRSFELLADLDERAFQIVLLPPHHDTNGLPLHLQRQLYRTLEERVSEGLLVLPNREWDLFELVLLVDTRSAEERATSMPLVFPRFSFDPRAAAAPPARAGADGRPRRCRRGGGRAFATGVWPRPAGNAVPQPEFFQPPLPGAAGRQ